ncbi:hypothetical protein QBC39DRAFT_393637 [Podospora conica]|nr:hypothetical protein QBC39DRAFT_393637 [Schizothecium conicum]
MATESLRGRSDEATLTSQPDPAIKLDTDSKDADAEQPHVNGDSAGSNATDDLENKHITDIVDDLVRSTDVSISGGSDNEAAKGDSSKAKDGDDKGHARALSSVKKPAAFKSISVNQKFLHVKSSAPTAPAKPSDKAAAAAGSTSASSGTLTSSRPRLVVKSTSGLVSKSSSSANGGKAGGAPDPSAVWNKNRPVPPPEPKNYTDEELKKYGIHMASRLQSDESKGGQNWADIDDDDEDWATDVITWKDGTKIEIPHADEHHSHAPAPEPAPVSAPVAAPAPAPAPQPATAPTSAPRLALKPNGLPEKPKLVTTGSSQSVIRPGVLASGKGLVLKGAPEKPTLVAKPPAPPAPVKSPWASIPKVETASPVGTEAPSNHLGPRQLSREHAVAKSTTPPPPKEIAADDFSRTTRREGSTATNRELYNSQSGRYEPVQDRRNSLRPELQHSRQPAVLQRGAGHEQQGPLDPNAPYGRRRGSSNVSGGSGSYMNRLRTHDQPLPPPEVIHARPGSMTGASDSPASPRAYSPSGQHGPPRGPAWAPRASPAMSHASPFQHHAQPAEIRNMPPAVQVPPAPSEDEVELQKKIMRAAREEAMKRRLEEEAKEEAARKERIRLKLEALGPAPESKSQKKAAAKEQALTPTHIQARELPVAPKAATDESKAVDNAPSAPTASGAGKPDAAPNGVAVQVPPSPVSVDAPSQAQSTGARPSHWPNAPKQPERYPAAATWGVQPTPVKNVWGAPNNNNRGLGNGTFDLTTQPPSIPTKAGPGPIGPPNVLRASEPVPDAVITTRLPPIGPPKQAQAPGRMRNNERDAMASAWTAAVKTSDDDFAQMLNKQYQARELQLQAEGRTIVDAQPVIKDTWRPTQIDDKGYRNDNAPKQSIHHGGDSSWVTASGDAKPQAPMPGMIPNQATVSVPEVVPASILPPGAAPQPTRGSRFFPPQRERQDVTVEPVLRPDSPSPPPPDMAGHPAFDGDVAHPHVSLPRPPVVVRLPPSIPTEPRGASHNKPPGASAPHPPSFGGAARPASKDEGHSVQPESWQHKFNALFGREKHASPRSPVEHFGPRGNHGFNAHLWANSGKDGSVTSKVRDEECFEEQEMGSLPPVHLPHGNTAPEAAYFPTPIVKPLPRRFHAVPSSVEPLHMGIPDFSGTGQHIWRVSFPGFSKNIYVAPPLEQSRSNSRRGGVRTGPRPPPSGPQRDQPRGGKSRDTSYTHPSEHRPGQTSNPSQNRGGRGSYRGGGRDTGRDTWNRSNAIQT